MRNNIQTPTPREEIIIKLLILFGLLSILNFLYFFLNTEYWGNPFLFALLCVSLFYSIFKKIYLWYNYSNISVPQKPVKAREFSVDILTTYFPGEPYQMIITTLEAINSITHPHTAYLCDEADDPYLKKFCQDHGIVHVTRDNRKDAKAGNINNALEKVATGEICVILDPDHIPEPDILDHIVPYFSDPDIGFVQIVQSYYNTKETLVARGAAEQTFQFYGPMMMTLNSYGAVNAIGANCVFRRAALDSIGGHAPGLCEDMHTAMQLYSKGWKAVYVPKILAQGLAPSNLTSYFKQQLKWSRGTFDLLFKVYPKLFKDFTTRQKIHFAILPLHYLSGLICLINFLIPILSLLFSTTPWVGNFIDFILALIPVAVSSVLIRTFIQKWVIEKKERGFHLLGGFLQINTWWINILGLIYTIFDKKIPYLPTPKENEYATNLKIVIPNISIAILSIISIIIGLYRDFTPFSLAMAGFAFFNALIMLFGIYLANKVTNQNNILKGNLRQVSLHTLKKVQLIYLRGANQVFTATRAAALPLLILIFFLAFGFKEKNFLDKWKTVEATKNEIISGHYLGIYHPPKDQGLSSIAAIDRLEMEQQLDFNIISYYRAWNSGSAGLPSEKLMDSIADRNAIPMITWEPWPNSGESNDLDSPSIDENILQQIIDGEYDDYIRRFSQKLATFNKPVFLRFAHEFDNPHYPWSGSGKEHSGIYKAAWKHVFSIIKDEGASKVMLVWNPLKPDGMRAYYPGDEYVDWIGVTLLNYGNLNQDGNYYEFEELYQSFHDKFYWFTRKPVMLAEFGSIKSGNRQHQWLRNAAESLKSKFGEIAAVVMFNSAYDNNIPAGKFFPNKYLNWTTDSISLFKDQFQSNYDLGVNLDSIKESPKIREPLKKNLFGVRYRKGQDWKNNYYVATRSNLKKDCDLMKQNGINTIHFSGGNIFDYNIMNYSESEDLSVIYEFGTQIWRKYQDDPAKLKKLKNEIQEKISDLIEYDNLIAFSFSLELESYFSKPLLFQKRQEYLKWLKPIIEHTRNKNPHISISIDLPLNADTKTLIQEIENFIPVDSYGLIVKDINHLPEIQKWAKGENIPILISSLDGSDLKEINKSSFAGIVLERWQDERLGNSLDFNGLLDFEGRKKQLFTRTFTKETDSLSPYPVRILKPAVPLLPNETQNYHVMVFISNKWIKASDFNEQGYEYEWSLIKTDGFGNPLALKVVGKGPRLELKIPENYKNYELLLTLIDEESGIVTQHFSKLHTLYN